MTDYASQGKTRVQNVVDLNNSYLHQSYYTALSRSASAAGTVILQGFDAKKITGRASGALRQEFRDIELLDEISRLTYEGKLHPSVAGDRRNTLISSYRKIKGEAYVPATVHCTIRWNQADPYIVSDSESPSWVSLTKATGSASATANTEVEQSRIKGSTISPLQKPSKRSVSGSAVQVAKAIKKHKNGGQVNNSSSVRNGSPTGTRWKENSCAYDAVVVIFYNIWRDDAERWSTALNTLNPQCLGALAEGFGNCNRGLCDL
ncbi:hypothetical protein BD779DRAFT_1448108, partial [Infundibulicybe gibba]